MIYTNIIVIFGAGLCCYQNWYALMLGRFLYGLASGSFSVFCPKYISETAPVEVKGPAGGISQICITFGILVSFGMGFFFP